MAGDLLAHERSSPNEDVPGGLLEFAAPRKILAVLLICAFGAVLLWSLGVTDIWSMHEGRVVEGARNMLDSGNFWVPTLNGSPRLEKSPLVYWIVAASGAIWGQMSEFTVRLPSLMAGLACVTITILIGRTLLNNTAALIAGLVQISVFAYWRDCRTTELDIYLTFFISLAMLAFCRLYFARSNRAVWVLLFWAALGCGAATKNVLTVIPALVACALAVFLCRAKLSQSAQASQSGEDASGISVTFWPWHVLGVIIFVVLALAWNLSMMLRFPEHASALWQKEIDTVLLDANSARPMYFYLTNIFIWAFPMSVLVPAALAVVFSPKFKERRRQLLFLFLWIVIQVLAYSVWPWSKKKLEYIQPMMPAFALLIGLVWNQLLTKQIRGRFNLGDRIALSVHSLLLIVCGLVAVGFSIVDAENRWIVAVIGGGLIFLGLLTLIVKAFRAPILLWGTILATLAAMIINVVWFLPSMNQQVSPRLFAQMVSQYGGQPGKVFIYKPGIYRQSPTIRKKQGFPTVSFYLRYNTPYLGSLAELKSFIDEQPDGLIISSAKAIDKKQLEILGLKILHQQDIDRASMPLSTQRLPQAWRETIGRMLAELQGPARYTLLLGTDR